MSNEYYCYPIQKIVRRIVLFELFFWVLLAVIAGIVFFISGQKEWIASLFSTEAKETFKSSLNDYRGVSFQFLHPHYFWFLTLILISFGVEVYLMRWKNSKISKLGDISVLASFLPKVNPNKLFWKYFWWRNVLFFSVIALTQPVFGTKKVSTSLKNTELIIGLDISNSMNVKDLSKEDSRLAIAKRAVIQLINNLNGEKVGVCVFAGNAYVQLPLTADYDAAKMYVNEIETDMVSVQGTNIAEAISTSIRMFSLAKNKKALVVVTDGESHEGSVNSSIAILKEKKIVLSVLGIGSKQGGYIPQDASKPEFGYKIDSNGKKVISKMNPDFIRDLAIRANGFASIASSPFPNLESLLDQINKLQSVEIGEEELEIKQNHFQLFCVFALISFLIYTFYGQITNQIKFLK